MNFPDLHTHLYGCLEIDDLRYLASRNKPRWEFYRASYRKTYGTEPNIANLFAEDGERDQRIRSHYQMLESGNFAKFQTAFDLVISLSTTDPEELQEIASRVCSRSDSYAEYRMMFSDSLDDSQFEERLHALCEAVCAENRRHGEERSKIAISLSRNDELLYRQYATVRKLLTGFESVRAVLIAVDFCAVEEGYPPSEKIPFIERLLSDNRRDPSRALALLYHAGESYTDKSVESAARWVVEAARAGVHRIGHAIALGIRPSLYSGSVRHESLRERRDQIRFEMDNYESLKDAGCIIDRNSLAGELDLYRGRDDSETIRIEYNSSRIESLERFQEWGISEIIRCGTVIEVCPTSNLRIAGLREMRNHPAERFVRSGVKTVIGTDDPGILRTDMAAEIDLLIESGLDRRDIERMMVTAMESRAELVSGRRGL